LQIYENEIIGFVFYSTDIVMLLSKRR
jgi:hypothetical protein